MTIMNLMPTGCAIETHGSSVTIHDAEGNVVAIVCAPNRYNVELARLIAGLPDLLKAIDNSLENGLLLPLAHGVSALDRVVFQPQLQPHE
jgi:hypothetical protein